MRYASLYERLAVTAADVSEVGRTIETRKIETIDNDQEILSPMGSLRPASKQTLMTATKETIDNDREIMSISLVPSGPQVGRVVAEILNRVGRERRAEPA